MNSGSVQRARQRMAHFPVALAECTPQALAYGRCVSSKDHVGRNDCAKEFQVYKECLQKAMSKMKK